jgi:16S rRNA (guanine527-N7)-methyltransferase
MKLLTNCLKELDICPSKEQTDLLNLYINEILKWNKRINLVKADKNELIKYHIADSLAGLKYIKVYASGFKKSPVSIADAGSGAGLPGIPLSIFMPDIKFHLIERSAKRASFLRNMSILMNTCNLEIICKDIKNIKQTFDIILFRAFTPIQKHIENFKRILNKGGLIIAYKGVKERIVDELENIKYKNSIIQLSVPDKSRHLVVLSGLS